MDLFIQLMDQFLYIDTENSRKAALRNEPTELRMSAKQLDLPRSALTGNTDLQLVTDESVTSTLAMTPFQDPDPYQEFTYPTTLMAKRAIADYLGQPLAKLSVEQREFICALVEETLTKKVIMERVRQYFHPSLIWRQERMRA